LPFFPSPFLNSLFLLCFLLLSCLSCSVLVYVVPFCSSACGYVVHCMEFVRALCLSLFSVCVRSPRPPIREDLKETKGRKERREGRKGRPGKGKVEWREGGRKGGRKGGREESLKTKRHDSRTREDGTQTQKRRTPG
jgi:hypothetical protein